MFVALVWRPVLADSGPLGKALEKSVLFKVAYKELDGGDKLPAKLAPGDSSTLALEVPRLDIPAKFRLRVEGRVDGTGKGEGGFRYREAMLQDAVIPAKNDTPARLMVHGDNDSFQRAAFQLVSGGAFQGASKATISIMASTKGVSISPDGELGLKLEFYVKSSGREYGDINRSPDKTIFIPFKPDVKGWEKYSSTFDIPPYLETLVLSIGGKRFAGTALVQSPEIVLDGGKNVDVVPFAPREKRWANMNLSRLAWPVFSFSLDGKEFFKGPCFQRAGNKDVDFEIALPDVTTQGKHELTIRLASDWPTARNYTLEKVGLICETARAFELVGLPRFVPAHSDFHILVKTNKPDVELTISALDNAETAKTKIKYDTPGLHVLTLKAGNAGKPCQFHISDGTRDFDAQVKMATDGPTDNVLLSTSDWIYINKEMTPEYFEWTISNNIANALVIRPSYQWNGTRTREPELYEWVVDLCGKLDMPYALMVEGRCLPGARINPLDNWLKGDLYLGRQSHEDDGSYYYWGPWGPYPNDTVRKLMERFLDGGGIFPKFRYKNNAVKDMADGARYFMKNIKKAKHESTRHTGPSVLFHYFYQVGYDWLGAEQCYGPEEVIMSALRGASKAYGKTSFGSHHATQWGMWSEGGYKSPRHVLAQFNSHAVAYMHGSSHINTEDALWTTENCEHRFTSWAEAHIEAQRKFLDFIDTHRRRGEMVVPIAVLLGRNDAWPCFGQQPIWGQKGKSWKPGQPEASFDLLKVFYPRKSLKNFSVGGTPYGPIDLTPVETPLDVLKKYDAIIFLGWNSYSDEDFKKLLAFVKGGGTLLLSKAHLNTNLDHGGPVKTPENGGVLAEILAKASKLETRPDVIPFGSGRIMIFDTDKYPADSAIRDEYAKEMSELGKQAVAKQRKNGWVAGTDSVEFAAWDEKRYDKSFLRRIFLLNTNVDGKDAKAKLLLRNSEWEVTVPSGTIKTIYVAHGVAAAPGNPLTSILDIQKENNTIFVKTQSDSPGTINVFAEGLQAPITRKIAEQGITTLEIKDGVNKENVTTGQ